jgi:hypothetical protein
MNTQKKTCNGGHRLTYVVQTKGTLKKNAEVVEIGIPSKSGSLGDFKPHHSPQTAGQTHLNCYMDKG